MQAGRMVVLGAGLLLSVFTGFSQKKEDIVHYINQYKDLAISEMKRTGVPAAIKLAQGIHETNAGTSDLVLKSNNHFGIKCKTGWAGGKVYHDDDAAGECFRSYGKAEDSYRDHSNFLKGSARYASLFELDPTDYEGWALGLKKAGYATNVKYPQILIRLIKENNLEQYTNIAMGTTEEESQEQHEPVKEQQPASLENKQAETIILNKANDYPSGEFQINNTKVVFVKGGTSWLSLADKYDMPLSRLLDFNDLKIDRAISASGQLVYIQRKRKESNKAVHVVQKGESMYEIAQKEGIRLESLLSLNGLQENALPAAGAKLRLQ